MNRARERADALVATFAGLEPSLEVAAAVVDGDEAATSATSEVAARGHFEVGSIGKPFTGTAIATHTSGLPRLAPNDFDWEGADPSDPYAGLVWKNGGTGGFRTCIAVDPTRGRGAGAVERWAITRRSSRHDHVTANLELSGDDVTAGVAITIDGDGLLAGIRFR